MSISKSKKRVFSLTGSTITAAVIFTVLAKNIFFKIEIPDIFLGNRKKFKTYEIECRIYF
jgi:hypothetical protein